MPAITRPTLTYLAEFGVRDGSSSVNTKSTSEVTGTRKFMGLWSERQSLAKYFLGTSEIEWDGGGAAGGNPVRLRRLIPMKFSDNDSSSLPTWYATRITVEHNHRISGATILAGDGSTRANYRKVCFTVHYEKPKFYIADDTTIDADHEYLRWTEWPKGRHQADVLALKAGSAKYKNAGATGADGKLVPYGSNRVQPQTRIAFIWRDLPPSLLSFFQGTAIPWQTRLMGTGVSIPYVGTINSTAMGSFAAGSLYLQDWEWDVRSSPVDDPSWDLGVRYDVTFNMIHRPTPGGWNSLFYSDPNGADSGYYYYSRANTYHAPGAVPDYDSLYNEREFKNLWKVQTV